MNDLLPFLKLSMLHTGAAKLNKTWCFSNVISPFVRLFLVTKGEAEASYGGNTFKLKSGYMYLIPSFTYNDYQCKDFHEQYYTGFFEEIKLGMSIFNTKKCKYEVRANVTDYDFFERLLVLNPDKAVLDNNPLAHINSKLPSYKSSKDAYLNYDIETQGILAILLSRFIENADVIDDKGAFKGDLNRVLIYIAKHLEKEISVATLAEYCKLSPDHFTKTFYSKFNVTPNKYIQLKRVERAQFLLLTSKDSLEQVAEKVGMKSLSYFSKKFKEIVGLSPAKFRKEQLNL